MKPFEIIEHTADIGIKVNGDTIKELFENAASGMFSIIGKPKQSSKKLSPELKKKIQIKKEVEAFEELLVMWLGELLYIYNKEKIYLSNFKIHELNNNGIIGEAGGTAAYTPQTEIKAITFHGLKIEESVQGFSCNIIFDV